jgi:hypothetical protein
MALNIYIILLWILLALFVFEKKSIGNKGIAFTLMIGMVINTHVLLIISEPLKLVSVTQNPIKYSSLILYRSFLIPLFTTYIINKAFNRKTILIIKMIRIGLLFLLMHIVP